MSDLATVQRAFARVCFDARPREEDLALLHDDRERWLMYRRMVRGRLFEMARAGLPKTAEVLGAPAFDAAVSRYLAEHGTRTRYIREVVHELVVHALPAWQSDPSVPPHLCDLARFEEAKWRASSLPVEEGDHRELDFEGVPVWSSTLCPVPLRFRVDQSAEAPAREDVLALVHRLPGEAKVRYLVLNPLGARFFAAWRSGVSCADGARAVAGGLEREPDARFVDELAGVLASLVEQKIILGSR